MSSTVDPIDSSLLFGAVKILKSSTTQLLLSLARYVLGNTTHCIGARRMMGRASPDGLELYGSTAWKFEMAFCLALSKLNQCLGHFAVKY